MDLQQIIKNEKNRVNELIQKKMDSSRFEKLSPTDEYVINNIDEFKDEDIGGSLLVYDHSDKTPFDTKHHVITSVIDKIEVVELVPQIGKTGELTGFRYYAIWSDFWFLNGMQCSHVGCFTKIEDDNGIYFTGLGDSEQGQYDLLLTTIEMEIDEKQAEMVKEWNDYKKQFPERMKIARKSVYAEYLPIIERWISG